MNTPLPHIRPTGLACGLFLSATAWGQTSGTPQPHQISPPAVHSAAPAPLATSLPAPNPEAAKAVRRTVEVLVTAVNTQAPLLDAQHFTEAFNANISAAQMQQVLRQLHQRTGDCRLAGEVPIPVSFLGSFLLSCDKAFVPVELAVEDKPPYRVHSLLIRPSYSKL